jgi:tellurite resistance protein TerC
MQSSLLERLLSQNDIPEVTRMDWVVVSVILQLIFLEGILSIDNAAVLGAMVTHLPDDLPIVWPEGLKKFGKTLHVVLGNQRTAALRVGLLGAYLGRGLMLVLAHFVIDNPWLRVVGAVYLLRLAFNNLGEAEEDEADAHVHPLEANRFWGIVVAVELTDLVFSLDNVVAAVALSDKLWVVFIGVALGILFMRFAAGWFSYLVEKIPVLKKTAYILVLNIAVELLIEDLAKIDVKPGIRLAITGGTILISLAYYYLKPLRVFKPVLIWLAEGFANINELIDWALVPLTSILKLCWKVIKRLFTKQTLPERN